jgi:hypothetical protein
MDDTTIGAEANPPHSCRRSPSRAASVGELVRVHLLPPMPMQRITREVVLDAVEGRVLTAHR